MINLGNGEHRQDVIKIMSIVAQSHTGKLCLQIGCRSREGFMQFCSPLRNLGYEHFDVVEAFKPNIEKVNFPEIRNLLYGDILDKIDELGKYDCVIHHHGPEHIEREEFMTLLPKIMDRCKLFIIGCPNGQYEQGAIHGNEYEIHKTHWVPEDFESMGFDMYTFGSGKSHVREHMMGLLWKENYGSLDKKTS